MATSAITARARTLSTAIKSVGLSNTNGAPVTHTQSLDILAKLEGFEAHSHKSSVGASAGAAAPSDSRPTLNALAAKMYADGASHPVYTRKQWETDQAEGGLATPYHTWVLNACARSLASPPQYDIAGDFCHQLAMTLQNIKSFSNWPSTYSVKLLNGRSDRWEMDPMLTNREGALAIRPTQHPGLVLAATHSYSDIHKALLTHEESCFMGVKNGQLGTFMMLELCTKESEIRFGEDVSDFPAEKDLLAHVHATFASRGMANKYPGIQFCIPNKDQFSAGPRSVVMAFISLKVLCSAKFEKSMISNLFDDLNACVAL